MNKWHGISRINAIGASAITSEHFSRKSSCEQTPSNTENLQICDTFLSIGSMIFKSHVSSIC